MRARLALLLALLTILLLPLAATADSGEPRAPEAPESVVNLGVAPNPAPVSTGAAVPIKINTDFWYNESSNQDGKIRFCLYVPVGVTHPASVTMQAHPLTFQGFATPENVTFTSLVNSNSCPPAYGQNATGFSRALYTSGTVTTFTTSSLVSVSGVIPASMTNVVAPGGYTYKLLVEEPWGNSQDTNPRTAPHTVSPPAGAMAAAIASFEAESAANRVDVRWQTASEVSSEGFNLYRSTSPDELGTKLNDTLIAAQGSGSSGSFTYEWADSAVAAEADYYYFLEGVATDGSRSWSGPATAAPSEPSAVQVSALGAAATELPVLPFVGAGLLSLAALAMAWRRRR